MRKHKPNPLRSLQPIFFGAVPLVGALLWVNLMEVLYAFIHQPPPMLSHPFFYGVVGTLAIGFVWSIYLVWADFVRGDYYLDLVIYYDR
ncbi:hypothetical protein [Rhodoferax sp.]|uniref:hypothetical protein n=1 Tax=Rhodoferax sp. TaxID=50421 RepID=UPI00260BA6ED|nr:hypothetical protein [Rhodoferax sp.]MDD3937567.1 hypothetical protein [Rhodoferax sp.]